MLETTYSITFLAKNKNQAEDLKDQMDQCACDILADNDLE